jgi:hypothetical protein
MERLLDRNASSGARRRWPLPAPSPISPTQLELVYVAMPAWLLIRVRQFAVMGSCRFFQAVMPPSIEPIFVNPFA